MKKLVKKVLVVASISTFMCLAFAGCKKETECEGCAETKKCAEYEAELLGETESGWFCDDCADDMKTSVEAFGGKWKKK